MAPDPLSMVFLLLALGVIAGAAAGIPALVKYLRRREADRQEMLELMRRQAKKDEQESE